MAGNAPHFYQSCCLCYTGMITGSRDDNPCPVSADDVQEKCAREKNESDRNPRKHNGYLFR